MDITSFTNQDLTVIIPSLTKHHNTLTKLCISSYSKKDISFIAPFKNLQELVIPALSENFFRFELQYATFPYLQILKLPNGQPNTEDLMKFLEKNGKNLNELDIDCDDKLKFSIVQFCPNLKKLSIIFETDTLKVIFNGCQDLESIMVHYDNRSLNEKELLEIVAKYSPKNFYELKIYNDSPTKLLSEDLESFLINWGNRIPRKSLTWIVYGEGYGYNEGIITTIEKYKKLGIIRKFGFEMFDAEM